MLHRLTVVLFFLFISAQHVLAISDPLSVPNNRFGIHITDTGDIRDTASLVNSTNGDWGYVTVVIAENDRSVGRWQEHFNLMRRLHLIPIVRIATHSEGANWAIPQKIDADKWADFLNSLNWPIQNRYVILFNEPNHAKEWGGNLDPEGYADITMVYLEALKKKSSDFFVLPAGFDFSASSDGQAFDAAEYVRRINIKNPNFFARFDGWTSHSYPNPGFSGSPMNVGRGTIASFIFEQQLLKQLGITKQFPIFISETGWQHNQGKLFDTGKLSPEQIGINFRTAATGIWQQNNIVAVTPFLFNYQDIPFDHFSFRKLKSDDYYPHFYAYQAIPKIKGNPIQYEQYSLKSTLIPEQLVINSTYTISTTITNKGQGIIEHPSYELILETENSNVSGMAEPVPYVEPNESGTITIHIKTPDKEGSVLFKVFMKHYGRKTLIEEKFVSLIPPPNITMTVKAGFKKSATIKDVTVLVYDSKDTLIHKFPNLTITNNQVTITGLYNMIPKETYRIVILAPYYLPRQTLVDLSSSTTPCSFKPLLPLDINKDGTFTLNDITSLFLTKPRDVLGRWF